MNKHALILIGGITQHPYIYKQLHESNFNSEKYRGNIFEFTYDYYLDKRYEWIPFYDKLKRLDKHGDWWQFFWFKSARDNIRNGLQLLIRDLRSQGYIIDVIAHSLGTWIALGSAITIDTLMLFGCPAGGSSKLMRWGVNRELREQREKGQYVISNHIDYVYAGKDFVSNRKPDRKIFNNCQYRLLYNHELDHNLIKYLNFYQSARNHNIY